MYKLYRDFLRVNDHVELDNLCQGQEQNQGVHIQSYYLFVLDYHQDFRVAMGYNIRTQIS